jgi:hypothetical protein
MKCLVFGTGSEQIFTLAHNNVDVNNIKLYSNGIRIYTNFILDSKLGTITYNATNRC